MARIYKYYRFDDRKHWQFPLNLYGLYFDLFNNFNDPHEVFFKVMTTGSFKQRKDIIGRWNSSVEYQDAINACTDEASLKSFYRELNSEYAYQSMRRSLENIRVTCFSRSPRELLMWSHYTGAHRGFCIEFDQTVLRKKLQFVQVKYVKTPPIMSIFKEYSPEWFLKHKYWGWRYEKEVRAFGTSEKCYFPPSAITGIYLGLNVLDGRNGRNLEILKGLIEEFVPAIKTRLRIAKRHRSKFKIEFEDYSFGSLEAACRLLYGNGSSHVHTDQDDGSQIRKLK